MFLYTAGCLHILCHLVSTILKKMRMADFIKTAEKETDQRYPYIWTHSREMG